MLTITGSNLSIRLTVNTAERRLLEMFEDKFGGKIVGKNTQTYWYVSGADAMLTARVLINFVVVTKEWLQLWLGHEDIERFKDGQKISEENVHVRRMFCELVALNRPIGRGGNKHAHR